MQWASLNAAVAPTCRWLKIDGDGPGRRENAREAGAGGEYELFVYARIDVCLVRNP